MAGSELPRVGTEHQTSNSPTAALPQYRSRPGSPALPAQKPELEALLHHSQALLGLLEAWSDLLQRYSRVLASKPPPHPNERWVLYDPSRIEDSSQKWYEQELKALPGVPEGCVAA